MAIRLFVIGNGFDLAHKLPTSISCDFKNVAMSLDGGDFWSLYSFDENKLWSEFESALSKPEIESLFTILDAYPPDYSSDHESDRDSIIGYVNLIGKLRESVEAFAHNAEQKLYSVKPINRFSLCFKPDDLFINFNYTSTLQKVYGISESQVLHIHGHVGSSPLLLGYKDGTLDLGKIFVDVHNGRGHMLKTETYIAEIEDYYVQTAYENLIKKIKGFSKPSVSDKLSVFLESKVVSEIKVIGHSLGDCDTDYFSSLDRKYPKTNWTITYHDNKEEMMRRINSLFPLRNCNLIKM